MGPLRVLDLDPEGAIRAEHLKEKYPMHDFEVLSETNFQAGEQEPKLDIIHGNDLGTPNAAEVLAMLSPGGLYLLPFEPAMEPETTSRLQDAGFSKTRFYRSSVSGTAFLLAMRPLDEAVLCDGKGMRIPRK